MSDVEQRARDALNAVCAERDQPPYGDCETRGLSLAVETLCRLIEQQDAFRREVSDAARQAKDLIETYYGNSAEHGRKAATFLSRFILPEPVVDPDIQIVRDILHARVRKAIRHRWDLEMAAALRANGGEHGRG
jgi:hypothetical protein